MTKYRKFLCLMSVLMLAACVGNVPPELPEPLRSATEAEHRARRAYQENNFLEAIGYYRSAVEHYRRIDALNEQIRTQLNIAQAALLINHLETTKMALQTAEHLLTAANLSDYLPHWQLLQSSYLLKTGREPDALAMLNGLTQTAGDPEISQAVRVNYAIALVRLRSPEAQSYIDTLKRQTLHRNARARLARLEGELALEAGRHSAAENAYENALEFYRNALFQPGIAATLTELGDLKRLTGDPSASFVWQRALSIRLSLDDHIEARRILERLEHQALETGNTAAAEELEAQRQRLPVK